MTKWINIALPTDEPSLVNIDSLIRIYPGLQGSMTRYGKQEACTLVFNLTIDIEYDYPTGIRREEYTVEVYLPIKEIMRRMLHEPLIT